MLLLIASYSIPSSDISPHVKAHSSKTKAKQFNDVFKL